jgi:hypothetical protein
MGKRKELKVCMELKAVPLPPEREAAYWESIHLLAELILRRARELQSKHENGVQEVGDSNPTIPKLLSSDPCPEFTSPHP